MNPGGAPNGFSMAFPSIYYHLCGASAAEVTNDIRKCLGSLTSRGSSRLRLTLMVWMFMLGQVYEWRKGMCGGGGEASVEESSQLSVRVPVYSVLQQGRHPLAPVTLTEVTIFQA